MFIKVLIPILAVLYSAKAWPWHLGPPPPLPEDHSEEILANQANILTGVQTLIKVVKEGQLLEMTYDTWMRQQNISQKLDSLVSKATDEKAEEMIEAVKEETVAPATLPVEEDLNMEQELLAIEPDNTIGMDTAQTPMDGMNENMDMLYK